MKLYEALIPLSFETLIYIQNVDRPRGGRVQYTKLRNLKWEKVRNLLEYDVMQIIPHKENGGLFIQVHDADRLHRSLDNWDLVDKYFKRKEQRRERGMIV